MKMRAYTPVWLCATSLTLFPSPLFAQPTFGTSEQDKPDEATDLTFSKSLIQGVQGPKYLDLRYDEDVSYLDGPEGSYEPDFFNPIKNVHLGPDWRLSLGGEFRFRLEAETNKGFGAAEPAQDSFALYRFLIHADLKYRDLFRVFVQAISAFDDSRYRSMGGSFK